MQGPCGLPFAPYLPAGCTSGGLAALGFGDGTWQMSGTEYLGQGSASFSIHVTEGSDGCAAIDGPGASMTPMPTRWYVDDSVAMAQDGGSAHAAIHFWYLCGDGSGAGSAYGETRYWDFENGQYQKRSSFVGTFGH